MKKSIVSPGFVKRTLAKLLKLDQQLGIVVDGNVASKAIDVGKYVNLINSTITGKPDGIYVATGAVSSGGTVTAADISGDAITDGVTNNLSEHIMPLWFNPSSMTEWETASNTTKEKVTTEDGFYRVILVSTGATCNASINNCGIGALTAAGRIDFVLPVKAGATFKLVSNGTTATVYINKYT